MDEAALARLHSVYIGLTPAQRWHLQVIVAARTGSLNATVCEDLTHLGLVRLDGATFIPTEAGRYVATLF